MLSALTPTRCWHTPSAWASGPACPLAGILAALCGVMLGFPVLRLRGDYLAIVTLAFGEIIRIILINWVSLTNGPNGITRHTPPDPVRPDVQHEGWRRHSRRLLPYRAGDHPARDFPVLRHPGARPADQLGHRFACAASRSVERGRRCGEDEVACRSLGDQRHQYQADGLLHRRRCSAVSPARSSPPAKPS